MDALNEYTEGKQILIVDDEQAILNLLSRRLGMLGYSCDTEPDGLRAILLFVLPSKYQSMI